MKRGSVNNVAGEDRGSKGEGAGSKEDRVTISLYDLWQQLAGSPGSFSWISTAGPTFEGFENTLSQWLTSALKNIYRNRAEDG